MLVCAESHKVNVVLFRSSFLGNDRILSAAVCWSYSKPSSTLITYHSLRFTSNSNHWCCAWKLGNFCSLKYNNISPWVHFIMNGILRYMLRFGPIKTILALLVFLMVVICLKNKLIKSDCPWAQVALTPIVIDKIAKIISSKIEYTYALEITLNSWIFLKT